MYFVIRNPVSWTGRYQKENSRAIGKFRFYSDLLSFSDSYFFLTSPIKRSVMKFKKLKTIAISNLLKATAMPIAPVFQILAAVAVPLTVDSPLRIAPPPIKPIPVIMPCITRASAPVLSSTKMPVSMNPHAATATRGKVLSPKRLLLVSRSHPIGRERP